MTDDPIDYVSVRAMRTREILEPLGWSRLRTNERGTSTAIIWTHPDLDAYTQGQDRTLSLETTTGSYPDYDHDQLVRFYLAEIIETYPATERLSRGRTLPTTTSTRTCLHLDRIADNGDYRDLLHAFHDQFIAQHTDLDTYLAMLRLSETRW